MENFKEIWKILLILLSVDFFGIYILSFQAVKIYKRIYAMEKEIQNDIRYDTW